jgi:aldose 1-epimerase
MQMDRLRFAADGVTLEVSPFHGGRIASFVVDGRELLVTSGDAPFWWGCFPMAPFAGRVRRGRFRFRDRT